ncbi:MAG: hypothetical protein NC181_02750 [Clostridium sp.]|nr:hypothetical protein [Clostridium sp.]MCM1444119.1 hypothetical protein [Candidatus Amulumruptor caecigallinarius]
MSKFKYLIKRIFKMNYGRMFKTINEIHGKTGKNRVKLFFDIIYCGIKYQAGYLDYSLFEMYNLNSKQRKTVITRGINNQFIKKYNNPKFTHIFNNKNEFNEMFKDFIKRDWMIVGSNNKKEFLEFVKDKKEIIIKPIDGTHGDRIERLSTSTKNLYEHILETKAYLVEEVIVQNKVMQRLNSSSVNTIRAITVFKNDKAYIVAAYIRIGNGKVVDNFNNGGMTAPINVDNATIEFPALDKKGNLYYKHPITNTPIVGFKIPNWEKIQELVTSAGRLVKEVRFVGWDVCITEDGALLIEGNDFPGHDIYQLPPHRKDGIGMLPQFERILNED